MGEADPMHEEHRRRHAAAHEHAAAVHEQAALVHAEAVEFFVERGMTDQADRERDLALRETEKAKAARREAASGAEDLPPVP